MKYLFVGLLASSVLTLAACNGASEKKSESDVHIETTVSNESNAASDQGTFSELFSHYEHLTFALSSNNDKEAANAAKGILEELPKINTEGFSADQKNNFDDIVSDIYEN